LAGENKCDGKICQTALAALSNFGRGSLRQTPKSKISTGWYGLEFVKHNTSRPPKQIGDYGDFIITNAQIFELY
jgi:hypothetical protein